MWFVGFVGDAVVVGDCLFVVVTVLVFVVGGDCLLLLLVLPLLSHIYIYILSLLVLLGLLLLDFG